MKSRTYHFFDTAECEMCGAPTADAQIIGMRLDKSQGLRPRRKTGIAVSVCRCRRCGLHFPQPIPKPDKLSDHYGTNPEEYWKDHYFEIQPDYFAREISDAKRIIGSDDLRALDIGCGIGKAIKTMVAAGFEVHGLEPSEPFRNKALELTGLPEDRIQLATIEEAEYGKEMFDFITFGAVLEHLYDPAESIRRALHWLRPGGAIQIEVPSSDHLISRLINLYYRAVGVNFVTNISPFHSPFHIYEFTTESFKLHGDIEDYVVAEHYYDVAEIFHFPKLVHPILKYIMEKRNSGMQLTVWLQKK